MSLINMEDYGLSGQFAAAAHQADSSFQIARILSQEKGLYRLICQSGERYAGISGKLRFEADCSSAFPAVGDFVLIQDSPAEDCTVIHTVLPRKTAFLRRAAGSSGNEQVLAANIDIAFICMSLNRDFNLRRLERYLSLTWNSGATPVIVLTKADLCTNLKEHLRAAASVAAGVDILITSGMEQDGYRQLQPYLQRGKTVALLGSSGVGKSTLINHLLGEQRLETRGLRKDDRGRHTTTHRELFLLKQGGMVVDTPGMRELGMLADEAGLDKTFSDIESLSSCCRFRNCSHSGEPGCAVFAAISTGELSEARWRSYQKLLTESHYTEDAGEYLAEKRQKFKKIAKLNKASGNRKEY